MWAAGMASVRLPSMMPGLRMEKGTAASGGLETWSILEGMPGWAGLGQWSELQRMEEWSAREKTPPPGAERRMGRNFKSVSRRQTAEHKTKNQYP